MGNKVPEVTAFFWLVKVLSTGLGEAASDALVRRVGPIVVALVAIAFVVALRAQLRADRYVAWRYWSTVGLVAVFGTMAADVPHALGIPVWATSLVSLLAVAAVFVAWYRSEGTVSFRSITTRRREGFYWTAVISTFALGTAVGDLTAESWRLGNLVSGLVFYALIAVPFVAHRRFGLGAIPAFWIAYVLTRPLGASFADWMGGPTSRNGLGIDTALVAGLWALAIALVLGYLAITRNDALTRAKNPNAPAT
ncbi:hypothetical protein LWC33_22520 [Pseudonocardia sp. RS11V-5]|uniref:COG4705 family protein n=1 Tax=Pseudonocardia terrae TaxID=2905831 RepID=UPI001E5C9604|nr:hypothetical protein [Pseudonocardia terrae]MCE3554214.1 hypothetical protein [Pseudonocardia terrae]